MTEKNDPLTQKGAHRELSAEQVEAKRRGVFLMSIEGERTPSEFEHLVYDTQKAYDAANDGEI